MSKPIKKGRLRLAITTLILGIIFVFSPYYSDARSKASRQDGGISISVSNTPLRQVLSLVEKQSSYVFAYNEDTKNIDTKISVNLENASIEQAMTRILENTGLSYRISGRQILIYESMRNIHLSGKVYDENNIPLVGAVVSIKDTNEGVTTDNEGNFSITAPDEKSVLIFSLMGYHTQEEMVGKRTYFDVILKEEAKLLDEVVVTALGLKRSEKALGYSTQKVKGELLEKVKGLNVATSLTGRVAGLTVFNSTEFMEAPTLSLRGETPMLVLDGVPSNLTLADINSDDIESIDVLKGATASALYGSRGSSGAIVITTKKSGKEGFTVEVNSSNMINCGTLALPKVQTSYSSGYSGKYNTDDEVWGDKLDIGRIYPQYNPKTYQMEDAELTSKGKNNFKNFLQFSFITNNTISVTQKGKFGSVRASGAFIYDKGQYPNEIGKVFRYNIGGEMKLGDKVNISATMGFSKQMASNTSGTGYNDQGYIYNLLVWTGPEYDIRDYRDYWIIKDEKQNWNRTSWYDNPWLSAYEKINHINNTKTNGMLTANFDILPWLSAILRMGFDYTDNFTKRRAPMGMNSVRDWGRTNKGYYEEISDNVLTTNDDAILQAKYSFSDFTIDGLVGASLYFYRNKSIDAATKNGLSMPGFYSLKASVDSPTVDSYFAKKQVNSLYAKATLSYKDTYYLDLTGRNDWSSTLPSDDNSYFYPSAGASILMSNIINLPDFWNFWKLRGSWTISKQDLGIYDTNSTYTITNSVWDGLSTAAYPTSMRGDVKPITDRSWEIGTSMNFLDYRLKVDFTYYNKLTYNNTVYTTVSSMSGFDSILINTDEEYVRRGAEIFIDAIPIQSSDFTWNLSTNWSRSAQYYHKLDDKYTADHPWIHKGARTDAISDRDLIHSPNGDLILTNGFPTVSNYYEKVGNSEPDWVWGLTNTFKYKDFTLSISIDGRIGGMSWGTTAYNLWKTGAHPDTDNKWRYDEVVNGNKSYVADGVTVVSGSCTYDTYGNIIEDTRQYEKNTTAVSYESYIKDYWRRGTQFYFDETFIKLRELSISYDIPARINKKLGLTASSVSLIGQNLLLWTKEYEFADPDKASDDLASPSVRYMGLNIKLQF
jgi:TonB-linked SusC/RagA family outer membrane protein